MHMFSSAYRIQIQHLLKLNCIYTSKGDKKINSNTTLVKVKSSKLVAMETRIFKFKYNTC